jgi:hypothetical protein
LCKAVLTDFVFRFERRSKKFYVALFVDLHFSVRLKENQSVMAENEVLEQFGKRIQRCYGCFIAYHLKDMYLGEDVTFFCEHCKDNTMFHFDEFSRMLDISKLKEVADAAEEHHHH